MVKDDKCDMFENSHSILTGCRNHISQPLNVHGVNEDRQTEIPTAEPLVPEQCAFECELAIEI